MTDKFLAFFDDRFAGLAQLGALLTEVVEGLGAALTKQLLVNERSCLDLFLTLFVFSARYSFGFIILLQLLHLAIGVILISRSCSASPDRCSTQECATALTESY